MEIYSISQGEKREMITCCYNLKMYGDINGIAGKEGRNGHSVTTQTLWKFIRKRKERSVFDSLSSWVWKTNKKKQQQEKLSAHKLIDSDGDRGMWRFNLPHVWWQDIYWWRCCFLIQKVQKHRCWLLSMNLLFFFILYSKYVAECVASCFTCFYLPISSQHIRR